MKMGTRSLLFGAHQVVLHPIFVALAWRKLYGKWPRSLGVWFAFVVHDWGYWGLGDMDGDEGKRHPMRGAALVSRFFDVPFSPTWFRFTAGHSRSYANLLEIPTSMLMPADKLATALMPFWLYVALVGLSGEWREYLALHIAHGYSGERTLIAWARHLRGDWQARYGTLTAEREQ